MAAGFDDLTVIYHHDFVRVANRRQPVRNNKHRAVFHQIVNRFLNHGFRFVVQSRRRLVQHDNRRIFDKRPRYCNPLFLSAGKQYAALADLCVQPLIKRTDKLFQTGAFYCCVNLRLRCRLVAEQNVFTDRTVKQKIILKNDGNSVPQRVKFQIADIDAVNCQRAGSNVVKTRKKVDQRRFAAARVAHQRNRLSDFNRQIDMFQNRFSLHILETDVFIFYALFNFIQFFRVRFAHNPRRTLQQPEHALHCHQRHLHVVIIVADGLNRIVQHNQRRNERYEIARRNLVRHNQITAQPDNAGNTQRNDKVHQRRHHSRPLNHLNPELEHGTQRLAKTLPLILIQVI